METYGELKQAIKTISLKQKGAKVGNVALDVVLGAIPGIGAAKSTFDFVKAAFEKPDTKKSNSWLDKLDVDDEVSAIVDDTVENGFLKAVAQSIDSESDETPLEQDFNMNQKMVNYLKKKYRGRTITGIGENKLKNTMKKSKLHQLIKEMIKEDENDTSSNIKTISKDLEDQTSAFKGVNNKVKTLELLNAIKGKLDPKFVESSAFSMAVREFLKSL